jgi:2'-5' RNA ligase
MQAVLTDEYTLWLEPEGEDKIAFQSLISDFATRAGTPRFEPHLTLLSKLAGDEHTLIERLSALEAEPISIHCRGVKAGEVYHKCLYIECENSEPLRALRQRAEKIFEVPPAEFYPHVSLAYGLDALPLRDAFVAELEKNNFMFTAQAVSLWHARGLPDEWRLVATRALSKQ